MFKALVISKTDGLQQCKVRGVDAAELPAGDVTIKVEYSPVNSKDGLAISGQAPVVRTFPMVPGITGPGPVTARSHPGIQPGHPRKRPAGS